MARVDATPGMEAKEHGGCRNWSRITFDDAGDIVRAYADTRPCLRGKTYVPAPRGGVFNGYRELGGFRLPTTAEVSWELPEGSFTYRRGEITSVETG